MSIKNNKEVYCYVINLESQKEKLTRIQIILSKKFSNTIFFKAVNGNNLSESEIRSVYNSAETKKNIGRDMTLGEIGCALSHLAIMREVVNQDHIALILEDDIDLKIDEVMLNKLIRKFPSKWECMLLGHHSRYSRGEEGIKSVWYKKELAYGIHCLRFAERPSGGYGYLINKSGAEKILARYDKITKPVDVWQDDILNIYGVTPTLVNIENILTTKSNLDNEREKTIRENNKYKTKKILYFNHFLNTSGIKSASNTFRKNINKLKFLSIYR